MLFGDKKNFGIESDFQQVGEYIFTQYCFWANSKKIGDNSQTCLISSLLENISHNMEMHNNRNGLEFEKECKNWKNFNQINFEISSIIEFLPEKYSVIEDYDECLDGYQCYLLEFPNYDQIIWRELTSNLEVYKIPKGIFYQSFEKINKWVKENTMLSLKTNKKN